MNNSTLIPSFDHIIAKAWADEEFKTALKKDPRAALEALGIEVPEGLTLRVVENTERVFNLVLPSLPELGLSEETLDPSGAPDRCGGCGGGGRCGGCASGGSAGCQSCNCICW